MNKKELYSMKLLEATDELVKLAKEDVPVRNKETCKEQLIYQRGLYLRAEIENRILKVAFYLAEYLSMDCRKPLYTLYVDKKNGSFIGYDYHIKKWTERMLDKTIFSKWLYKENSYMQEADTALIQKYLESEYDDAFYALYVYQCDQRHRRLGMKYEKILANWDQRMDRLPEIPKDWLRWQKKVGITQNFIFYHYSRKKDQTGHCSWCESEVPIRHPHHNAVGRCPKCRHQIQYKAVGRAKNIETKKETAYLLQTCGKNVFVLREFQLQMLIVSSSYKKPVYSFFERRRILYDEKLNTEEYYFGRHHWKKEYRWIQGKLQVPLYPGYGGYMTYEEYDMGNIYGKSLHGIKNRTFRKTGFQEYAKAKKYLDPVSFFEMVRERPYLERLIKAGLYHLTEDIMDNKAQIYCEDSGDLGKALGIDRFRLKRLRTNNGGEIFLQWLLLEKAQNKLIRDDVILWMCREKLKPADLMFIMDRMNPLQIRNYLEKQASESGESVKNLIKTWKDYLDMAIRVGVNVQDSVIYRARKLIQRHNEMIKEIEAKNLILRAGELEKKYPGLNRICRELKKYAYVGKEYQIVVPEKVDDILYEAKLMHHCVNNTETYYERMSQQESYILFLRKTEKPTEAYYTLEVEPDGTIRQTRARAWRTHCTWEDAVKHFIEKSSVNKLKKIFVYKGKEYQSVAECCRKYDVRAASVRNRASSKGCSLEEALDHFIMKKKEIKKGFVFRDKSYATMEECCKTYSVSANSVSSRKYRLGCSIEESLEHFIKNKEMITFRGREYPSLRACCKKYGIEDACVRQRARDQNCSLEESFEHFMTRKRKYMLNNQEFEYRGILYPSLKECCEKLEINKNSVVSKSRRSGCSLQEAVEYYVKKQHTK